MRASSLINRMILFVFKMPPEGEEWTGPIQREDGFITERIHAGYSIDADEGEMQLQEEDTYKHYYLDVFASRRMCFFLLFIYFAISL